MTPYAIERHDQQVLVTVAGDLTAPLIPDLQGALKSALEPGTKEVQFDLQDAVMLDSSGIGLLIAAANSLARTGGKIRVSNVTTNIFKMLRSMRLSDRLNVTERPGQENSRG